MPAPFGPNKFRELLPSSGGSACEKLVKNLLRLFIERVYLNHKYERKENGDLTEEFAADICALGCFGGGTIPGPGGTGLKAPTISATDGAHLNKVVITWNIVTGATSYDVYRNTINNNTSSVMLGSSVGTSFDDTTAAPGVTYFYWVKSNDGLVTSSFSAPDTGFAANEITAVSDLDATKGFSPVAQNGVRLVWTPVPGAQKYDIYRSEVNVFIEDNKIDSDRIPFDRSQSIASGSSPVFIDNGGELVYFDQPPDPVKTYYYWVRAKGASSGSISAESNSAVGWTSGFGDGVPMALSFVRLSTSDTSEAAPSGAVRARVVLFGAGAGGAGAGPVFGGGGGGAGAVAWGILNITGAAPTFRIVYSPNSDTGRAAGAASGTVSSSTVLQFAPDGVTFSTILTAGVAAGGVYSATGGGIGGTGGSAVVAGTLSDGGFKDGRPGKAASGSTGGRSGYYFGGVANPPAHFFLTYDGDGSNSTAGTPAGSGSMGHPTINAGGEGKRGTALIFFHNF